MNRSAGHPSIRPPRATGTVLLVWAMATLFVYAIYRVSQYTVLSEIRHHAMGVAIATAASLSAEDVRSIRSEEDRASVAYQRIQQHLDRAVQFNPDIRYIYVMRRSLVPFSPTTAFEYVVDQPARDRNRDGVLGADEQEEPPGKAYDGKLYPAMLEAWQHPSSDRAFSSDPPYPCLLSGYAPIRNADQQTVGIVGVDITAETVQEKLQLLYWVSGLIWLAMGGLGHLVVYLYFGQRESRDRARQRNLDLLARNELLRRARFVQAQFVAPPTREPQPVFDRYDLAAVTGGSGLFRLFELDQERLGVILADSRIDPSLDALIICIMDQLMERIAVAAGETVVSPFPYVDPLRPAEVLALLGRLLAEELPPDSRVALLYGVIDFSVDHLVYAAAGSMPVLRLAGSGEVTALAGPGSPALHPGWSDMPAEKRQPFMDGDVLMMAGPGAESDTDWRNLVQQEVAQAGTRDLLALVRRVCGSRPVAVLHIR